MDQESGEKLVKGALVQLRDKKDIVRGCGLLISPNHIVTCAHVVADCIEGVDAFQSQRPGPGVHLPVIFPYADFKSRNTEIVAWAPKIPPPSSPSGKIKNEVQDLAILSLKEEAPGEAIPSMYRMDEAWADRNYRAHAFPSLYPEGSWVNGKFKGEQLGGWVQMMSSEQDDQQVEPGFSGAGVWDVTLQGFAGIIVTVKSRGDNRRPIARMIPGLHIDRLKLRDLPGPEGDFTRLYHQRALKPPQSEDRPKLGEYIPTDDKEMGFSIIDALATEYEDFRGRLFPEQVKWLRRRPKLEHLLQQILKDESLNNGERLSELTTKWIDEI